LFNGSIKKMYLDFCR